MFQLAFPINTLPLQLVCAYPPAQIAIQPTRKFNTIFSDCAEGKVASVIDSEGILLSLFDGVLKRFEVEYNMLYEYKEIPILLQWLQELEMIMPKFKGI